MTTDVKTDEGAVERLQEAAPAQLSMAWLDEHRDDMVLALEEHGRTLVCSRLGFSVNTVRTWERRRGLLGQSVAAEEEAPDSPVGGRATNEITRMVHLESIKANPWQPRKSVDPEYLRSLAESILLHGLLQVPIGRPSETGVQLAFGHQRIDAIRILAYQGQWEGGAPILLRDLTDQEMAVFALEENAKRKDINQLEQLRVYRKVIDDGLMNVTELADSIGLARSTVSNNLRILALPDVALEKVGTGEMGFHAAREFLCFDATEHDHNDDIEAVVEGIAGRPNSYVDPGPANWSVKNVRAKISQRVVEGNATAWRAVYKKDVRSRYAAPMFDTDAFQSEYPRMVHNIPGYGDKSHPWTCNVKEWQRRQGQETRKANEAAAKRPVSQGTQEQRHEERWQAAKEEEAQRVAARREVEEKEDQAIAQDVHFADATSLLRSVAEALMMKQHRHGYAKTSTYQYPDLWYEYSTTARVRELLKMDPEDDIHVAIRFTKHIYNDPASPRVTLESAITERLGELNGAQLQELVGQLVAYTRREFRE